MLAVSRISKKMKKKFGMGFDVWAVGSGDGPDSHDTPAAPVWFWR